MNEASGAGIAEQTAAEVDGHTLLLVFSVEISRFVQRLKVAQQANLDADTESARQCGFS